MNFLKKNKMTIGGALAVVVLIYVYFTYFSGGSAPLTALSADQAVSGELLTTLGSLHTIKLDSAIFTNPVFVSLSDFGVSIPPQQSGRRNPFAPIGQGALGTTTKP